MLYKPTAVFLNIFFEQEAVRTGGRWSALLVLVRTLAALSWISRSCLIDFLERAVKSALQYSSLLKINACPRFSKSCWAISEKKHITINNNQSNIISWRGIVHLGSRGHSSEYIISQKIVLTWIYFGSLVFNVCDWLLIILLWLMVKYFVVCALVEICRCLGTPHYFVRPTLTL